MLPDVGMVKTYTKCLEAVLNTIYRVQATCEMNTCTNMTVSDVIEAHATVLN